MAITELYVLKDVEDLTQENVQMHEWLSLFDEFLILIDEKGTVVQVNQAWIDFCMAQEADKSLWQTGTNFHRILQEHGKHHEIQAIQRILNNEQSEHQQMYPLILKDEKTQWLSVKIQAVHLIFANSCGALICLKPATLHDIEPITGESVLESMTDGFVLLNNHFQFHYINEIAEGIYGMKRENMIGKTMFDLFPEITGSSFHLAYQRALDERTVIELMDYYQPLNIWFQVKIYPLKKGGLALYFRDVSKQKKTEDKLLESAHYDYLTELPNRQLLTLKGLALIAEKKKFTVFYLNVDNLKLVNSRYNHDARDAILKNIAEKLTVLINDRCTIGRLDGDAFVVVYEPAPGEMLEGFVQSLTEIFEQAFLVQNLPPLFISASIGIACYPYDAAKFGEVVSYAETAMYEAKKIRGSSYLFFRPAMYTLSTRKSIIEESLAGNLKNIGLYYKLQPQIDEAKGEMVGVEVLARWNHPELGEISPLEFIEVAEATAAIAPMTLYLIENLFNRMSEWKERFGWNPRTAINITPSLLANPDFFGQFFLLIERYEIQPEILEIEITEQVELTYSEKTLQHLLLCKSKGISIALDDFGTGFSMISYLTSFPITKIKIDRSFIQKIGQDQKSEAVLKSIIYLAKSIECKLVAEGVERPEEVEFLKANNCCVYQGYLYDKPLQVHDFENKYLQQ